VTVKIYNPAKTVADCFKYRHKIGLDIAIEALKTCRAERKCYTKIWILKGGHRGLGGGAPPVPPPSRSIVLYRIFNTFKF